jgi:hypothetical protein
MLAEGLVKQDGKKGGHEFQLLKPVLKEPDAVSGQTV